MSCAQKLALEALLSTDGLRKGHPSVPETSSRRPRGTPGASETPLGVPRAAQGISLEPPRTLPRRLGDASEARGSPGRVSRSILGQFWVPQGWSRERFWVDLRIDFQDVSRAIRMRFAKQKVEGQARKQTTESASLQLTIENASIP